MTDTVLEMRSAAYALSKRRIGGDGVASDKAALVGRGEELAVVEAMLGALSDEGAGGVLEVSGEPGIGKTRLVDELATRARSRGYLVLSGRAAEFEGEAPFGVFVDAMDDHLAALGEERLVALAGSTAPLLAVAMPAFEALAPGSPAVLTEERFRTHRAVRALVSRLAEHQPLVLVLDDVHWADAASVEMLSHLLAHPPLGAVLLVVAFRRAQVSPRLDAALATRLRQDRARRLDLVPLAETEAHQLLGPAMSGPLSDQLFRQSGGNPFYLQELARGSARASATSASVGTVEPDVPASVAMVLESEIASLSAPAQALLQGAAVAGDPFDADLATIAADLGTDEAAAGLDELAGAGIINPAATPRRFAFRHPIVRAAVYQSAADSWVVRAHARVAQAMAERGEPASVRAHHIERSASVGDVAAVAELSAAGDLVASRAPAVAAQWYRAALRLLPAAVEAVPQRISLLMAMATALGNSGCLEGGVEALTEVLDLLPATEPTRATVVAFCAGMERLLGRPVQARARLLDAYNAVADRGSRAAVALAIQLSAACAYVSAVHEARAWAEQALAGSRALGDRPMEAMAATLVSFAGQQIGLPVDAELSEAADLVAALGDTELATRLDVGLVLSFAHGHQEHFDQALRLCERAIRVARATGQGAYLSGTMAAQARVLMSTGRLTEAKTVIDEVTEACRLRPDIFLPEVIGFGAVVASWTGDNEAALRLGEEAVELARLQEPGMLPAVAGTALGTVLVEIGQFERAKAVVFEMCGGPELTAMIRTGRVIIYEVLTRAEVGLGRLEAARRWAKEAEAATHGDALAFESAISARAHALVLSAEGRHGPAADLAVGAADRAESAGSPVEAARCRIIAGRCLAQVGQRDRAVALLEGAEEQLTLSGAFCFRDQADKELRRLGKRVTRRLAPLRPDEGLQALTERERELADLVAQGKRNRQIAAAAYISEKTVERHLSHIYAKLGVSSRTELAAAVAADPG